MEHEYTQEQLNSLIKSVEEEFSAHLAKAEESFKLAKSEESPEKDESKEKDEKKASDEGKESKKPIEEEKPEDRGVKDQHQEKDGEAAPKDGEAPKAAAPAEGQEEGHGYDDEDMQHMHAMYSSMTKPELKAHHDTIRKCMSGMGLAKCEDGMAKAEMEDAAKDAEGYRPNGGPKDGEAAKAKTPASSDAQALNKSEPSTEISLLKAELEAEKAKGAEEKKNLEAALQTFLTKFVEKTAPAGKAITSLDIIAKTESAEKGKELTKSEIHERLLAKSKDASLSKSDRDAITSYYFNKNVESVRHLL